MPYGDKRDRLICRPEPRPGLPVFEMQLPVAQFLKKAACGWCKKRRQHGTLSLRRGAVQTNAQAEKERIQQNAAPMAAAAAINVKKGSFRHAKVTVTIMYLGKNLQYLRQLSGNMTQEALAEKINVSRQTISKWEMDAANPEIEKALELCKIFHCSLDHLFREDLDKRSDRYTNLRVEDVEGFRYVAYTVISTDPESDAINKAYQFAKENGDQNPKLIGWDFPKLSAEQINVYHMHGYTAAWIVPKEINPEGLAVKEQKTHTYAAIHIDRPFDDPFVTIPGAYRTLHDFMQTNGLVYVENTVIPCFETNGESMDVYIACK